MRKLGLTGGIGSGKSTVASMLVAHGARLIDADALSRTATQSGGAAIPAIRAMFGDAAIAEDGSLNRAAMRQTMLEDARAKAKLEALLHPLIGEQINQQLRHAQDAGVHMAVLDIPLLVEGGTHWRSRCEAVWVVDCLPATQIARVRLRSGWPIAQIEAIMAAQASRSQRLSCADAVIFNDGLSLQALEQQVVALLNMTGTR